MKTTPRSLAGRFVDKVKGLWKHRRELDRRRGRRTNFLFESLEDRALMAGDLCILPLPNMDGGSESTALVDSLNNNFAGSQTSTTTYSGEGEAGEGEASVNDLVAFAKALTAAGVKMYGAAWCPHCTAEKALFEDGAQFLTFIDVTNPDHTPNALASAANNTLGRDITVYPTWEFAGGEFLEGEQMSLAAIATKAGIAIPQNNLPSFTTIPNLTLKAGSPLWVSIDGYDPNNTGITYTASSSNPSLVSTSIPDGDRSARIVVDGFGTMTFHLFESLVPRVTDRFIAGAQQGLLTNSASNPVEYYRIANSQDNSDFVIQGGRNGVTTPFGQFDDQFSFDLQHNRSGLLSMAKSTDDTNGFEHFVTGNPTRFLDFNHSVFGVITEGDAIRQAIQDTRTTGDGAPPVDITINRVEIFTDTENGALLIKAPAGMTGTTNVTVTATDADGHTYSQTFQVTVIADDANGAPFLSDIGTIQTPIGTPVNIQLVGNDVEGDASYFDAAKPSNVTIDYTFTVDHNTGLVTITPPAGFVGIMPILVGVRGVDQTTTADAFDTQLVNVEVVSGTPTSVDLLAVSDTGTSNSDNVTNAGSWDIKVDGVTSGASVKLYKGNTLLAIGQATGTSITLTVQSSVVQQLGDGVHAITATQTVGTVESNASAPLSITYDTIAPGAFSSTPPTAAMVGLALSYDAQSADEGSVAYELVTPPAGATINPSTGVLSWTPTAGQVGAQTFGIRAVDAAGNATIQTLNINVADAIDPQVGIFLFLTNPDGSPLTSLTNGQNFILKVGVIDLRDTPHGVFGAFMDVTYDSTKASVTGPIVFGNDYATSRSGDTSTPGLIDEVGGVSGSTELGQGLYDLFSVPMVATGSGFLEFLTNPADIVPAHQVLVYRENSAIPNDEVQFGTVSIGIDLNFDAKDDVFNVNEDSTNFPLNPLTNDTINAGASDVLTITAVGTTNHGGTVTIAQDGKSLNYTPGLNFNGEETFTYTVSNQSGATDVATIRVQVQPVNDPPTAVDDAFTVAEDSGETLFTVLTNDSFAPDSNETLKVQSVSAGSQGGTIAVGPSGNSVSYVPKADFIGTETFTYTLSDGNGGTSTATVTVTVTPFNDPPTAANDNLTVAEDSTNNLLDVLANDSSLPDDDETITLASVGTPSRGGSAVIEDGKIKYTPAANFQGNEQFTYTISDGNGGTATALVSVTVTNSNDPPTATNDTLNAFKNTTTTLNVLANDTSAPDPTENLIVGSVTQPAHGSVAIAADGKTVTYTPTNGYTGPDTFTYTVRDPGGLESTGTVNVTVLEFVPSSLSGFVYFDVNNNGIMDAGEAAIVGAVVTITGTDFNGATISLPPVTTNSLGQYTFNNLAPGNYTLTETQPDFVEDGKVTVGSQGGTQATNKITVQLAQGVDGTGNNFGEMSRQLDLITLPDFFSSRAGSHLLVTLTSTGSTYSAFGSAWNGFTAGTFTKVGTTQLRIEFTNPQSQRVGTTISLSDPRVIKLGTEGTKDLYQLRGKPADYNFTAVTANTPPTISNVTDKSTVQGTPVNVSFTVGDAETSAANLTVTATSSNTALISAANLVLGGSGANRTLTITSANGQTGTSTITLTVTDGNGATATDTFVVTVTAATNNPPTISNVTDKTTTADTPISSIAFTVADVETAVGSLTVTATSSNTTLVPVANITFGGSGANRTVTITPAAGQIGTTTITLTVSDGNGGTASDSFVVTVTSTTNTAPTISSIADQTTTADTALTDLPFTVGDAETAPAALTVTAASSNTTLVPVANITLGGSGADRTVTITPAAGQTGTATITLTVNDGTGGTATETFVVTVNAAANTNPTISSIADQTTSQATAISDLPFTVGDAETDAGSLTVTADSTNTDLVPVANITFGGSGANRTVTVTPAVGESGTATITLTVSDGNGGTATETFVVTVNPTGNTNPTITSIGDQSISEDTATSSLAFTVGDAETDAGSLIVTAASSNTTLVPVANITIGGTGASRTVIVTPATGQSGSATITLTVDDGNGGTTTTSFDLTVTPASSNTNPTISSIEDQNTNLDTAITDIAFTVDDAETSADSLTVTASSTNTTLVPVANITFGGTGANRTVTITPATGETGVATITLTVSDGNGGFANETFVVTVGAAANTSPTISSIDDQTTALDVPVVDLPFTVGDTETDAASLTVTAASDNTTLVPVANIVFGGSGASRTVTITPATGETGVATITLTVDDGNGGTATETFVVTVAAAANTPPTISAIDDQTTEDIVPLTDLPFTVGDAETDPATLTITTASSNTTLIPTGNITFGGSGASRTVAVTPVLGQSGTSTITLTVDDGNGGTATETFVVTVTSDNDQPTISAIANQTTNEATPLVDIAFTVEDVETAATSLSVTATSSDLTLIPLSNVVFGGSGVDRTVTITPAFAQSGTATITITVSDDDGGTATTTFTVEVTPNTPPTISDVADQTTEQDTPIVDLPVTVGDANTPAGSLVLAAESDNTTLVPVANIVIGGSGADRTVTITPATGETGVATITLTVTDDNGATSTDSFTVTVTAPNLPPNAVADSANVTEDAGVPATGNVLDNDDDGGDGSALSVSKVDGVMGNVGIDVLGLYGTFHINGDGSFTYTLDDSNTDVDDLNDLDELIDLIAYSVFDGFHEVSSTLSVHIQGVTDII